MDRRTSLALTLALLVFVAFSILQSKYAPKKPLPKPAPPVATAPATPGASAPASPGSPEATPGLGTATAAATLATPVLPEKISVIETPLYRAEFSNRGARLVSFELKRFAAAHGASDFNAHPGKRPKPGADVPPGDRVRLAGEPTFAVDLGSGANLRSLAATSFAVAESVDAAGQVRALTFTAQDSAGMLVRETWRVHPDSYLLDLEVETHGVPAAWKLEEFSLSLHTWPLVNEANQQNDLRGLRAVSLVGKDLHRDAAVGMISPPGAFQKLFAALFRNPDLAHEGPWRREGVVHWAGVQSHYFLALVGGAPVEGHAAISSGQTHLFTVQRAGQPGDTALAMPMASGTLVMPLPPSGAGVRRFVAYFGPADYFALSHESGKLEFERAVDMGYGWLVPISKLLLWLLRGINHVVHNFGITILLLATIVRLALHPLNVSSIKSMRAMQRLQPEMNRIKEKYKNDPQAQNTAMMALYRENGVNPTGGCLPMFVQMPLLFAMYAVIGNAIDLRQAGFFGWIHDLSAPDVLLSLGGIPVRLLPLLMAGTGLLSQRFTPTDPAQAPTMYMMNVMMLVFFYNLPSGLVFYWTVMNLLTALQQWSVMHGDGAVQVVVPAEATPGKGRRNK